MQLIEAYVQNPVKVSVGMLFLMLFGFIGLVRMPMQLTPEVQIPTITISTRWPGAAPQEIEREIVQEQEEQLKGVEGVVKMSSECMNSRGTISLEFGVGTDLSSAMLKVNTRLQQVPQYPEDADEPVISTSGTNDSPIAWFILRPRVGSPEEIAAFQAKHPDLAEALEPSRLAHNSGLATRRLLQLVDERPQLKDRLEPLLPVSFFSTRQEIQDFAARHSELAERLAPAGSAANDRDANRLLEKLIESEPALHDELEELLIDVPHLRLFVEDHIEAQFERADGVSNSNVFGGQEEEMQVIVDPEELAARRLTISDLRTALRQQNRDATAGDIWDGKRRYIVRVMGQFTSPEDVGRVIIARRDGLPVYVDDVATIRRGFKKPTGLVKNFGTSCMAVNCVRRRGANVLDTMDGLRKVRARIDRDLLAPRGLQLIQVYDETDYIYSAIHLVNQNIIVGGLLTVGVLLLFLRSGRSTVVIALAIPTSLIGTFLMLDLMGRSLNVISLAGLAFAVGMLVDNAVVVLENIYRHNQAGESPAVAAVRGAQEVWGAVVASTLTTLAVFLPVLFVEEEAGQLFRDIALAISSAVALSLLVSITVIPTAAARIFRKHGPEPDGDATDGTSKHGLLQLADAVGGKFVDLVVRINRSLQRSMTLRLATVAGFIGTALLTSWLLMPKVEYLPNGNRNLVFGILLPPAGYNIDRLMELGKGLEDQTKPFWDINKGDPKNDELEYPPIDDYFFVASGRRIFFGIRAVDPLRAAELVPLISDKGNKIPGTIAVASQASLFGRGLSSGRTIDVEITGPDPKTLVGIGGQIMGQVMGRWAESAGTDEDGKPIPGRGAMAIPVPSLDLSSPEFRVLPKWDQAADMGLTKSELDYAIDALVDGAYAGDYFKGGKKIDLTIIGHPDRIRRIEDLQGLPIATPSGDLVPLGAVADYQLEGGPEQINRRERQRAITIRVTPPETIPLEMAIEDIDSQIIQPLRDSGQVGGDYRIRLAGTADKLKATWNALRWNFLLALLITYLLMAALFESWLYPFVIILSVPLGAVGGLAGLALLNLYLPLQRWLGFSSGGYQSLDVLTMLGFVILIGTVVNNAILIVHQSLNHMRNEGMSPNDAIIESVRTRIRPIFMTTSTTVLGLSPLVLFPGAGSELYRGLGAVVLGGLTVSTLFTLILVPTLFSLMMETKAGIKRRLLGRRQTPPGLMTGATEDVVVSQ
ncbi:MAG: efflux RND transporter permease subunit [Thermoguttaceae bacterium]